MYTSKKSVLSLLLLFIFLTVGCQKDPASKNGSANSSPEGPLFSRIEGSGIDFKNPLVPTAAFSSFDYQYFQNGGGVAIADFDQDGLEDVFFTANQKADRLYHNQGNLKFKDISSTSGTDGFSHGTRNSWSTGVTITDINQDGYPDIYICKSGPFKMGPQTQNLLYVNNGDLTFTEKSASYGLNDPGHSTQAVFFDADRDGDLDAYILNHSASFGNGGKAYEINQDPERARPHSGSLYLNNNNQFEDITIESGICSFSYGLGVVASDLNNDGWTDIYVANDFSRPDNLFINHSQNGKVRFKDEVKEATGHTSYFSMGCDAADINNDGELDISVVDMAPANNFRSKTLMPSMSTRDFYLLTREFGYVHQYMFNSLQLNNGNNRYSEIAKLSGVAKTDWSWATLLADYDNDGLKDIFVSNGYKYNKMENDFSIAFREMMASYPKGQIPESVKNEWINKPPSYKLKNYFFHNLNGQKFKNTSEAWGIKENTFSNGAAYGDLDNDGDLDLIINNLDDPAGVYRNNSNQQYLQIILTENNKPNLAATLNTKVDIYYNNQQQHQELTLTRGFQSACSPVLHFGLGTNDKVDSVRIIWPDQTSQTILNPAVSQRLTVDRKTTTTPLRAAGKSPALFTPESNLGIDFIHSENEFNDFEKELLLPHQNSRFGPFIGEGDVNGDQRTDLFIGGAKGQSGKLYLQKSNGKYAPAPAQPWLADKKCEDMQSVFFDIDNDNDLDLYVVSGGNEMPENSTDYQDRLYLNNGKGVFTKTNKLPTLTSSGSCVVAIDFDQDGWQDLFVGGRMAAQRYPYAATSYLLKNNKGTLEVISDEKVFDELGIVTDAIATDWNNDQKTDLIVVGEWTGIQLLANTEDGFENETSSYLQSQTGWWNRIEAGDFNADGKMDYIVGNLGLNYKYKASEEEPFEIYANDFDGSGNLDIVLGYFNEGKQYPLRGRECSSEQMPFIKEKFPTFEDFASATLGEVYGEELKSSLKLRATNFATSILINEGNGEFDLIPLPKQAQYSCTNAIVVKDFNNDQHLDVLLAGNMFAVEPETPRNDANIGVVLTGDGTGKFTPMSMDQSGIYLPGDLKDLRLVEINNEEFVVSTNNDSPVQVYKLQTPGS